MAAPTTIAQYLATLPPAARTALRKVVALIRKAAPAATEHISYGMPTFKLDGNVLLHVGAWREHFSLYPVTEKLVGKTTAPHELSHKGTVRFPLIAPVPATLISTIAKRRIAELRAKQR